MNEVLECPGFPDGHACGVLIPDDQEYCRLCGERQDLYRERGLPGGPVPVGVVIAEFDPVPTCECGGWAEAPDHQHSLMHARWAWSRSAAQKHEMARTATIRRPPGRAKRG